jgi:hypothetical protein
VGIASATVQHSRRKRTKYDMGNPVPNDFAADMTSGSRFV